MADANVTLITLENLSSFKTNYDSQIGYTGSEQLMTTAEKTKLSGIETGAEKNIIETVKVNGTGLTPDGSRAVNIDLSNYALKADIVDGVRFKDTVATYDNLPTSGQQKGDMYIINTADPEHDISAGEAVIWNGTAWADMAGTMTVDLSDYYTKSEADGKYALKSHTHTVSQITDLETWIINKSYVTSSSLTTTLGSYYKKTECDDKFQTIAGMSNYVTKSGFSAQLTAVGGYDSTNNPVATSSQITALFN